MGSGKMWKMRRHPSFFFFLFFFFLGGKYLLEDSSNMEVISRFMFAAGPRNTAVPTSKSWEGTSASLCIYTILYKVVIWFLSCRASGLVLFLFSYLHPIRLCDDHISVRGLQNCFISKKNSFWKKLISAHSPHPRNLTRHDIVKLCGGGKKL